MSWFPPARPDVFVNVRVENLRGIALEWAIAANEGLTSIYDYTSFQPKVQVYDVDEPGNVVWWLQVTRERVRKEPEWEPLSDWLLLGELIDKYDLTFTTTHRDHPDHRFMAFCPGDSLMKAGHGYAGDKRTALLRSILLRNNESEMYVVPLDLAKFAGCHIYPEHLATCESSCGTVIDATLPESERHEVYINNDF